MKKIIFFILLLGLLILTACQPDTKAITIDGVEMINFEYLFSKIGIDCSIKDDEILLKEDNITLSLNYKNAHVARAKHILYVMKKPAVKQNGVVYLPIEFFTVYLNLPITINDNKQVQIPDIRDFSLYNVVKFLPRVVIGALENKDYPYRDKILKAVELPRSMNIETPNITWHKIIETSPLDKYSFDFKGELIKHGLSENEISSFSKNDFDAIEASWRVPEDMQQSLKKGYPELKNRDISNWTFGDYRKYYIAADKKGFEERFSEEEKQKLKQRGILLDDLHWLLKDFHNIDVVFEQPDSVLKNIIEAYYKFAIGAAKGRLRYDS